MFRIRFAQSIAKNSGIFFFSGTAYTKEKALELSRAFYHLLELIYFVVAGFACETLPFVAPDAFPAALGAIAFLGAAALAFVA